MNDTKDNDLHPINAAFIARMQYELLANTAQKGNWREWQPELALLDSEMKHHLYKLNQAVLDGNQVKVSEYAADIACYAMKYYERFGENKIE